MTPIPQPPPLRFRSGARGFWTALGMLVLLAALAVALFYAEEDWRGARAWAACQKDFTAKGETLDWHAFVPPPVPDDQNLAMAPLFVRFLHYQTDPKTGVLSFGHDPERFEEFAPLKGLVVTRPPGVTSGSWDRARHTDLPAYQSYYRGKAELPRAPQPRTSAEDVLFALSNSKGMLDELAQEAAKRPRSRFPVKWDADDPFTVSLPQYNAEQVLIKVLCLRASANLAADHPEDALGDMELCQRLCSDMSQDPILISHLMQITCIGTMLTPAWEGLADRRWNAIQLARLQERLERLDLLADATAAHRGERVYFLRILDFNERHRDLSKWIGTLETVNGESASHIPFLERVMYSLAPSGWFDLDKTIYARHMQKYYVDAINPKLHRFSLLPPGAAQRDAVRPLSSALTFLLLPVFDSVDRRTAKIQTGLDEAVTACALERFYLDHQNYPAGLGELVPDYLPRVPNDVIDGAPLRYHLTPDGRYQLYGVGWDQRDNGGRVFWTDSKTLDLSKGDWVWQYTELQPPSPVAKK